jgi:acetoin utilization deacetylase AcuC-like enzyme
MTESKTLRTFYNPNQTAGENDSFSPSAGKPALVVEAVRDTPRVEIVSDWRPLSVDEIALAHDRTHAERILRCEKDNGFSNRLPAVAETLPWTNGSFYHAAVDAVQRRTATFSPTSGFHHAEWDSAMGFCTFNGLMIAALLLQREGLAGQIGIVDLDVHYGNGTDDIARRVGADFITHLSFGDVRPAPARGGRGSSADATVATGPHDPWVAGLTQLLETHFADQDVLLYQAGADPHVNDPLGGALTTEQLRLRDRAVFTFARRHDIPIVWNLAGGYQRPVDKVVRIHVATLEECVTAWFGDDPAGGGNPTDMFVS